MPEATQSDSPKLADPTNHLVKQDCRLDTITTLQDKDSGVGFINKHPRRFVQSGKFEKYSISWEVQTNHRFKITICWLMEPQAFVLCCETQTSEELGPKVTGVGYEVEPGLRLRLPALAQVFSTSALSARGRLGDK